MSLGEDNNLYKQSINFNWQQQKSQKYIKKFLPALFLLEIQGRNVFFFKLGSMFKLVVNGFLIYHCLEV